MPREVEPPLPFEDGRSCSVVAVDVATWATGVLYPGTAQSLAFPRAWLADGRLLFMVLPADPPLSPALWEVRPDEDTSAARPAGDVPVRYDDKALRARRCRPWPEPPHRAGDAARVAAGNAVTGAAGP